MASLTRVMEIKERKLDVAKREYRQAVKEVQLREREYSSAKKQYMSHREWRITEEAKRYKSIIDQVVQSKQLDEIRSSIASMYEEEASLSMKVLEAEKQLEKAQKKRDGCHDYLQQCIKNVEKYEHIINEISASEKIANERAAEEAMDEFSSTLKR
ncbi:type III secretion system stalk subunit SctO [Microbulbifer variabilis]|uniref:type III secretion system stalk subunit SctO n=1 Tax=Microbulbifer variabilis TaxID=266805 RepID=UPI001CFE049F|nr:YscO family type III secretion system apparatus protein [Microbulbifer variabilis]